MAAWGRHMWAVVGLAMWAVQQAAGMSLAVGFVCACALLDDGTVKCWGRRPDGLGTFGDQPNEMGAGLPAVDFGGGGRAVLELAMGMGNYASDPSYMCAVLDDGTVRCVGTFNGYCQLGPSARSVVDLGTGRTARHVGAGAGHSCAVLDTGAVKCWGLNDHGELGQGDTQRRGCSAATMGDSLPVVDVGAGRTVLQVALGYWHTCALLGAGAVKCWGYNDDGRLGYGDTTSRGAAAGQMGDALPAVDLGAGRTARAIAAGGAHTCALLDGGALKCWGWNGYGQLGCGHGVDRGGSANQMGDNLPAVALGPGRVARQVSAGWYSTCAVLDDQTVKCWGSSEYRVGYAVDWCNAPVVDLGAGRKAQLVATGWFQACALLDARAIKCWGRNQYGQLGYGDNVSREEPGEMGDRLPSVDLDSTSTSTTSTTSTRTTSTTSTSTATTSTSTATSSTSTATSTTSTTATSSTSTATSTTSTTLTTSTSTITSSTSTETSTTSTTATSSTSTTTSSSSTATSTTGPPLSEGGIAGVVLGCVGFCCCCVAPGIVICRRAWRRIAAQREAERRARAEQEAERRAKTPTPMPPPAPAPAPPSAPSPSPSPAPARAPALTPAPAASSAPTPVTIGASSSVACVEAPRLPDYWRNQDEGAKFADRVDLSMCLSSPRSGGATDKMSVIEEIVKATWTAQQTPDRTGGVPIGIQIVSVYRNENSELWSKYVACSQRIRKERKTCTPLRETLGTAEGLATATQWHDRVSQRLNEVYAWHGTTPSGAARIASDGFRIHLGGTRVATTFGKGLSFADHTSKADESAGDDPSSPFPGIYSMLLCRVVLGQAARVVTGSDSSQQQIEDAVSSRACDSIVGDREGSHREFTVYDEGQAYPEYTILYKRIYEEIAL